jgi:hypothetical protein
MRSCVLSHTRRGETDLIPNDTNFELNLPLKTCLQDKGVQKPMNV